MEQNLYGFIGYRDVTFITTRWESSYCLLYFLENGLKADLLLFMKEHKRLIQIWHLKLSDFFLKKKQNSFPQGLTTSTRHGITRKEEQKD